MHNTKNILGTLPEMLKKLFSVTLVLFLSACDDTCPTIQDYKNEGISTVCTGCSNAEDGNCLLCRLFRIITEAASAAANMSWNTFASQLIPVVGLAAAIYIAIYVLKNVGSFTKQNAADFLTGDKKGLLLLMFKTTVIISLLKDTWLIDNIISPVMQAGLNIGAKLSVTGATMATSSGSGYDAIFKMVNESVKQFNDQVYETIAIGNAMICNATRDSIFDWYWLMLLYGLILFVFGWILLVGISFYIVDILIRLAFGAILLPFGVACAISNQTVGYTKNIWNIFLNVFFSFIMLGIILGITIQLVNLGMTQGDEKGVKEGGGAALNAFLTNLNAQIDANQIEQISKDLWSNGSLLLTIVCFCVIVQLAAQIGKLADKISETGGLTSVGSQVAAATGHPLMAKGKQAAGTVGGWVGAGAKEAGRVTARVTRADKLYRWAGNKAEAARGILTGSGKQGYRAFWHKANWK